MTFKFHGSTIENWQTVFTMYPYKKKFKDIMPRDLIAKNKEEKENLGFCISKKYPPFLYKKTPKTYISLPFY